MRGLVRRIGTAWRSSFSGRRSMREREDQMTKSIARSVMTLIGRKGVRLVRALGSPFVDIAKFRSRRRNRLAPPIDRQSLARQVGDRSALEIGPFFTPLLRGANVSYFDVLDRAALRERAKRIGGKEEDVPEINFVSPTGDLAIVDRQFDVVVSAHVIEHQPDLVRHLENVADILRPGGEYWLVVPDRRYSFDYALPESSYEAVIAAHKEGRKIHSTDNIIMHLTQTVHNNALLHWLGWHSQAKRAVNFREHASAEVKRAENGEYVDVHAWVFAPLSFNEILIRLYTDGFIKLKILKITDTAFGKLEFFARLRLN